ncbi:MAG: M18 family aminopeptidase [Pseudohongiella sp.]|uniref:M18 family aminopeptidase n=1 Tax=Pseudohongiella sp. TaxID=1979412 RepID=UPI0034A065F1
MDKLSFNEGLLQFLRQSPTPFHAVQTMQSNLQAAGFELLNEEDTWHLESGKRYIVQRNGSSIIAFTLGQGDPAESGFRMTGAHTDSPCLKLKPNAVMPVNPQTGSALQFAVEVYGGALLAPWFDRDLSLAGRVEYRLADGSLGSALLDWQRPLATVPSLAIHLDREANSNRTINAQKDMPPVLALESSAADFDFNGWLVEALQTQQGITHVAGVLAHELYFYDTQAPAMVGLHNDFIASARLDNLLSCYVGQQSLLADQQANADGFNLLVCNDHEEVGSNSACGAQGPFLRSVLARISARLSSGDAAECVERMIRRSLFLSIDNAHGLHPNFADKHDGNHGPLLNQGPVIKVNANQRYATNSRTTALFRSLCEQAEVPVQTFVVRSDMGCGSTIGPITASGLGVETIDIGVPTYGMHSIRELAGSDDAWYLARVVQRFYQS